MVSLAQRSEMTSVFSHPKQSGGSNVAYTFTHSLNTTNVEVRLFWRNSAGGSRYRAADYYYRPTQLWCGYDLRVNNSSSVTVYLYWLGEFATNVQAEIRAGTTSMTV